MLAGPTWLWRFGQVAEWLMAADCKSADPWIYGGSNPPLSTSFGGARVVKLLAALVAMALLAVAADRTLTDQRMRLATFIVLGFFAVRILFTHRQQRREEKQG
jgi:hypothetical protein